MNRLNVFPFLLLPGAALVGYCIGDGAGAIDAVGIWALVIGVGTLVAFVRHLVSQMRAAGLHDGPSHPDPAAGFADRRPPR